MAQRVQNTGEVRVNKAPTHLPSRPRAQRASSKKNPAPPQSVSESVGVRDSVGREEEPCSTQESVKECGSVRQCRQRRRTLLHPRECQRVPQCARVLSERERESRRSGRGWRPPPQLTKKNPAPPSLVNFGTRTSTFRGFESAVVATRHSGRLKAAALDSHRGSGTRDLG